VKVNQGESESKVTEGHRARLKERFDHAGFAGFHDYEILELLLTYVVARKDTKPLAKNLCKKFGGFTGVLNASRQEILSVPGMGVEGARVLAVIREACQSYLRGELETRDLVASPQRAAEYCRMALGGKPHEVVHALFLDSQNRLIAEKTLFEGTVDESRVYPRRVVEESLRNHAAGVILSHNHPSGRVQPSQEDEALTQKIREALKVVEIKFLDHVIVGAEGFYSFREEGFFNA